MGGTRLWQRLPSESRSLELLPLPLQWMRGGGALRTEKTMASVPCGRPMQMVAADIGRVTP